MRIAVFCFLTLFIASIAVSAQTKTADSGWENKPVDRWDAADVKNILENSAWSRTVEGAWGDQSRIGTIAQKGYAKISLRSALVVRLALIRNLQLAEKYESMDAKAKAAFNQKYKPVLECPLCEQYYIVAVSGDSRILQSALTMTRRSDSIYLANEKGARRSLGKYSPQVTPGSEALFFFPRLDDKGNPLITADNVTLTFNLILEPGDDPVVRALHRVEIKVQDIVRSDTVVF